VPLWLYIAVNLVVALIVSPAIAIASFAAAARLWRAPSPINSRSVRTVAAVAYAQVGLSFIGIEVDDKVDWLVTLVVIAAALLLARYVTRARWGRSILIVVTYLILLVSISVLLALAFKSTIAETYRIPTAPMAPTIQPGDRIVVDRTLSPQRWDIVVYRRPWEEGVSYVGRLVGLPGEQVEIAPPGLKINGKPISLAPDMASVAYICRPYPGQPSQQSAICNGCGTPLTLGPDEYFFLGDNSAGALDSRYWEAVPGHQAGALPKDRIIGVVRLRYAPLNRLHAFR
jgi:signal peptidase I